MNLRGKKVLVTGASSGIGQAIALACAERGGEVIVHYRKNLQGAEETARRIDKHSKSYIEQADLTALPEIVSMFERVVDRAGDINVLVNNAGEPRPGDFIDEEVWKEQFENVFFSALHVSQVFLKQNAGAEMRKILNISSCYGNNGGAVAYPAYSVAKASLSNMTVALAKIDSKLLVNAIAPGYTWTPPWEGIPDDERKIREARTMIKRFIEPEEVAHISLAVLENDAITGQVITIDGGLSLERFSKGSEFN